MRSLGWRVAGRGGEGRLVQARAGWGASRTSLRYCRLVKPLKEPADKLVSWLSLCSGIRWMRFGHWDGVWQGAVANDG